MKNRLSFCLAVAWLFSTNVLEVLGQLDPIEPRPEHTFRIVPWCINGHDEPEFQRYPLTDFKPFIDRHFNFILANAGFRYKINLFKVTVDGAKFADSEYLQNVAHLQFQSRKQRFFEDSVNTEFVENNLEGLIIQMNYAPFGVGLPTGNFLDENEMNCFDCQYPLGQVVGCKKKTWLNLMHPTVLVYHHKMKTWPVEINRTKDFCDDQTIQKYCGGISNVTLQCFTDANCETNVTCSRPPATFICFSAGVPVYSVLPDPSLNITGTLKDCTQVLPDRNKADPAKCDTASDPPETCELQVEDPRPNANCKPLGKYYGKTPEVHGNIAWYTHPCHFTRRVRFLFLAVHSFSKGLYTVAQTGEFELPNTKGTEHNPFIPSPIFTGFRHVCEPVTNKNRNLPAAVFNEEISHETPHDLIPFDFSFTYDECMRNLGDGVREPYCTITNNASDGADAGSFKAPKVTSKGKAFEPPPRCVRSPTSNDDKIFDFSVKDSVPNCARPCDTLPTTTIKTTTLAPVPFIKRSFHGGINFVTNFCIMPVCIFIARFYKETFNLESVKGAKSWYWMHLFGATGSSVLMYIGYFDENYVEDHVPHVIYGNTYVIFLAVSYISSWTRHKNPRITQVAEIIHSVSGYSCFFLALCCMHSAPDLDIYPKVFVYISVTLLGIFYVGMECHVCILDKKIGMQPRRRHFPTIEAKFQDLPVPKREMRIWSLVILSITILLCTLGTILS